ncbi:MAG: hypothetical protein ABJD11_17230 [Gemmatimonadota bacterium]
MQLIDFEFLIAKGELTGVSFLSHLRRMPVDNIVHAANGPVEVIFATIEARTSGGEALQAK